MKVSVVIPAYNEEKYIGKLLDSLNNQTVKADEIIVVDNNSIDKTATIALERGAIVVKEKRQGMIHARNCGFNSAKFEIIARCDSDVVVPKNWIKKIKSNFNQGNIDALTGPVTYYDMPILPKSSTPSKIYLKTFQLMSRGKNLLIGMNMILTKKIWIKVRKNVCLDDKKVHEDIDLSLKINSVGGNIGYDQKLIVNASARRILKHPESFFIEYPIRLANTFIENYKSKHL